MKKKNFETELPQGYQKAFHINAQNVKIGIIFNVIAFAVMIVVMAIAFIPMMPITLDVLLPTLSLGLGVSLLPMIVYMILHELIHGIAYKSLTGQKLTFGISWSCAFCGVPNIYTYRKTALIALTSPLIVFTVILIPLTVVLYFYSPVLYIACALLLGLHLGGCCGDIYMTLLLLIKYKDKKTLIKDTGPEQTLYLPSEES